MQAGLASVALDGDTDAATRLDAIQRLRRGELRAIFTVDIFNEGVDIPEVDTLLLLRPTESATVFLQQLGRGLRWAEGKSVLTVLDFIGQAHAEYRFDIRYRAMVGGTRRQVEKALEHGFPLMPPGCAIRLDEISQKIVLENLRTAIRNTRRALVDDLAAASVHDPAGVRRARARSTCLTCTRTLRQGPPSRPYGAPPVTCAGAAAEEAEYAKALGKILHVTMRSDTPAWRSWLTAAAPPAAAAAGYPGGASAVDALRRAGPAKAAHCGDGRGVRRAMATPAMREELVELLDVLRDRGYGGPGTIDPVRHRANSQPRDVRLYEVSLRTGSSATAHSRDSRGPVWAEGHKSDLFFVTLNKSDEDYTPSTRYQDYPISQTLFHWESQSRALEGVSHGSAIHPSRRPWLPGDPVRAREQRDDRGVSNPICVSGRHDT